MSQFSHTKAVAVLHTLDSHDSALEKRKCQVHSISCSTNMHPFIAAENRGRDPAYEETRRFQPFDNRPPSNIGRACVTTKEAKRKIITASER